MSGAITNEDLFKLIQDGNREIKNDIKELKSDISKEIDALKQKNIELQNENQELKNKLLGIEKRLKKYNFLIYGITESNTQIREDSVNLINGTLKISCTLNDFRDIQRIGQKSDGKNRPVLVEALTYQLKSNILNAAKSNYKQLKQSGIFFALDYTTDDYQKRKLLNAHLKATRAKHYKAFIKNNKLVVNGEEFTYEDLQNSDLSALDYLENIRPHTPELDNPTTGEFSSQSNATSIVTNSNLKTSEFRKKKQEKTPTKPDGNPPKVNTRSHAQRNIV